MDICARPHVFEVLMFLMSVLTLADDLCCAWFIYSEMGTSSIDLAELSSFHLKKETESVSETLCVLNKTGR
jgi:hypothetical protein